MGQLKFEKDFGEKLNKRKIEPKAGNWEELSARLNSEEKSKRPIFWWIGIAATLVGGILIFSILFNEPISETPEIVNAPAEEILKEKIESQQISVEKPASEEVRELEKSSVKPVENIFSKKEPVANSKLASMGKPQESSKTENDQTQKDTDLMKETKISGIPEEVIAEASSKENKTGKITDAEVDALLAEALTKIKGDRSAKSVSENIDAKSLLLDVEMELEQSIREKVFDVLKEGYFKAKTAVVNRN
ncbi:MAG: hypothetical protein MUP24_05290 [Gillisia sp.]|nr:hypothetical protein [Gillisia sp.]